VWVGEWVLGAGRSRSVSSEVSGSSAWSRRSQLSKDWQILVWKDTHNKGETPTIILFPPNKIKFDIFKHKLKVVGGLNKIMVMVKFEGGQNKSELFTYKSSINGKF
jgi:hypothetical protein